MTSPDGITWTSRTSAADNDWRSVTYGNGLFVAVSTTGSGNRVMTSGVFGGGGNGSAPDAPPPWLQSYGRTQSQTCKEGWSSSWAEWAIGKTGGWVCNRTVFWNGSAWVQNPDAVWGEADPTRTTPWDGS